LLHIGGNPFSPSSFHPSQSIDSFLYIR
jgi:hypothetical protein